MNPSQEVLDRWADVVINTADYMADYVFWDKAGKRFVIGPPVIPVSENTKMLETMNPIFELGYWRFGLRVALDWAKRLGLPAKRVKAWKDVLRKLSDLPTEDGYYITHEGMVDMWTNYNFEHPALTGVYGWLPGDGVDVETFRRTFHHVLETWQMDRIWGWDTEAEINVVWVNISTLRKKLAELGAGAEIRVHRGTGYSLEKKA